MVKKAAKKAATKRAAKKAAPTAKEPKAELMEVSATINDPLGCCQYADASGRVVRDSNVRQSECLKIPGSIFDPSRNGNC